MSEVWSEQTLREEQSPQSLQSWELAAMVDGDWSIGAVTKDSLSSSLTAEEIKALEENGIHVIDEPVQGDCYIGDLAISCDLNLKRYNNDLNKVVEKYVLGFDRGDGDSFASMVYLDLPAKGEPSLLEQLKKQTTRTRDRMAYDAFNRGFEKRNPPKRTLFQRMVAFLRRLF